MVKMRFGKHKGQAIDDIPLSYLRWLIENVRDLDEQTREAIKERFNGRSHSTSPPPSPPPPSPPASSSKFEQVVRAWHRLMTKKYHPDRGGHHEAMVAVNEERRTLPRPGEATRGVVMNPNGTVREAAKSRYLAKGRVPVPLRGKHGFKDDWEKLRCDGWYDLNEHFPVGQSRNIGLLMGEPSGGLVDADSDCDEARAAAVVLLPYTGMAWGRKNCAGLASRLRR